uniref:AP2/ERF domain-containing protein n=1 Tax=Oryza punctata TaxID=4537 RepID=A0A0E0L0Y2_ORYPU
MSPADSLAAGRSRRVGASMPRPKRVRVYFVDADATDTDSSGDERSRRRVREVIDIDVGAASPAPAPARSQAPKHPRRLVQTTALARRRAGMAPAAVYDDAALRIKGSHAVTNFPSDSDTPSAKAKQMKLHSRRHITPDKTTPSCASAVAVAAPSASVPDPTPEPPEDRTNDDSFNPFASPTSVLRYAAADEVAAPSFEHLLVELGDLSAPPPSTKAAEFDWLPWWEGEDFVTAGLTASNAVSVK